jgi:hypothetical protein
VTKQTANGLETAIATFLIALTSFYYLSRIRSSGSPSAGKLSILGILLGITVLARIDGLFLVLVILLDYLLQLRKRGGTIGDLKRFALIPMFVLLLFGPWLLLNLVESGNPLQDSGKATRFLSLCYASYFHQGPESLALKGPNTEFIWSHVTHSLSTMKVIPPVHVFFRSVEKLGEYMGWRAVSSLVGNIMGLLIILATSMSILKWRKDAKKAVRLDIDFLLLFAGLLLLSYSLYIFGAFFFMRYFYPLYLIATIYFAFILQDAFDWFKGRSRVTRTASAAAVAVYIALFGFFSYSQAFRSWPVYPYYDIAGWVDENIDENEKVGVFQCGTIGYLSSREIVNLDGKVNRCAFDALKKGCLEKYLQEEEIDVVLDHWKIIELFFGVSGEEMERSCSRILNDSKENQSGWIAYRHRPVTDAQRSDFESDPGTDH